MAKVTGPLFSLAAHGTYRGQLVFITRASGTHVAKPLPPVGPRSLGQQQTAQKVKDLSAEWTALVPADKTAWAVCGALVGLTGYQLWWREWFLQGSSTGNNPIKPC